MNVASAPPRIPNLFIVGAPKCGTTAWVEYLRTHPDIFFANSRKIAFLHWICRNFASFAQRKIMRSSLPSAAMRRSSAKRRRCTSSRKRLRTRSVTTTRPRKILIFLRDQEEYLPSLHNQFLTEFSEEIEDFETVWRLSARRPPKTIPKTCLEPQTLDYAAMGRFREQVERYLGNFPAEHVRVIWFRDWVADPRATYLEILGVPGLGR